jgi:phosphoglycerol transferase
MPARTPSIVNSVESPSSGSRPQPGGLAFVLRATSLFLVTAQLCTALWFRQKFGKVEIDQLLYHLQQGSGTVLYADRILVWSGIKNCILGPVLYTTILMTLAGRSRRKGRRVGALLLAAPVQAVALLGAAALLVGLTLTFPPGAVAGQDWIGALYRKPAAVVAPKRRKNLILIYGESLEFAYGERPFDGHLLHALDEGPLAHGRSFAHFRQLAGTGWTIAGLVASQCGVPLKPLGIVGYNLFGDNANQFLPKALCLGDVLRTSGYRNVFLGGASTQFAGKGMFLQAHGYDEVLGREDWLAVNPEVALNQWGLNDDDLFTQAAGKLAQLAGSGRPFNLTILTVGMHPPDGFLAPSCPRQFGDLRDAVACTAHLIERFLQDAQAAGYLRETDVVVLGDHLSQRNSQHEKLDAVRDRSIYNRFLTSSPLRANRSDIDHFDLAPTILSALGYRIAGGQFGLGCSALGPVRCKSLVDDPLADAKLEHSSAFYNALWDPASHATPGEHLPPAMH